MIRLEAFEAEIELSPMLKVFQACGGAGVDAPSPPSAHFTQSLCLKGAVYGKLVEKSGNKAYTVAIDTYVQAIKVTTDTQCKKQRALLILDKSRLLLQWSVVSESIKRQVRDDMAWIVTNLKNVDKTLVGEARRLHDDVFNHENKIKEVLKAMNVIVKNTTMTGSGVIIGSNVQMDILISLASVEEQWNRADVLSVVLQLVEAPTHSWGQTAKQVGQ